MNEPKWLQSDLAELKTDVKDIKQIVTELQKSDAVQTVILKEHERRSTQLEEQFKATIPPIVTHVSLVQKIMYFLGAIALAAATQVVLKLLS